MLSPSKLAYPFLACLALLASGCATFENARPAPAQSQPIVLNFTEDKLSDMVDLPLGISTLRVPNSQVIIAAYPKEGTAGRLFDTIGILPQNSIRKPLSQIELKAIESTLQQKVRAQAQELAYKQIATRQISSLFSLTPDEHAPTLDITSAILLSYVNDYKVRPFALFKVSLHDATSRQSIWSTRYIASTRISRPLVGENSWTANDGALLKQAIQDDLYRTIRFMLEDIPFPQPRDNNRLTTIQGRFPFNRDRIETQGYLVGEDDDSIAFIPKLGDVLVFTGVSIMDRADTPYHPTRRGDHMLEFIPDTAP
ncbi:hypothetical protein [Uliginosibacterium gangwonense]|uniref:hypothetical protein n=1 Tax=Uliginosibacterium gangwonense TaxID=392736 RepID=UPI00037A5D43|nr:hypothetical protein [Uliginosibacterium gangwonense]